MLAHPRNVSRINDLRVFDPPAPVAGIAFGKFLNRRQNIGIGGIANGVNGGLEIVHRGAAHQVAQLRRGEERQPLDPGFIGVRCLQARPA